MCNTCLENHNKWPPHVKHRVVRIKDVREGRVVLEKEVYCQEHKADKQKYICTDVCVTCKKFICLRCRMLYHDKKGHTVQDAEEYNASTKKNIVSLQSRGKMKATTITKHVTCIKAQKKRVTDHITCKKAEINKSYQESLKKLNKRKAALDKQLDAQVEKLCKILDEIKDVDERFITSIESASVLAGNSMKAPLEGDIIVIRDTLSGELRNVLDRADPENKLATDVADRAEQLIFTPNNQYDQLNIGQKGSMNGMAATSDGRMAVGYSTGGIDIFSADGQLHKTVLKDVGIREVRYLSDGRWWEGDQGDTMRWVYT
ncbi:E3 ubiquitin-protein ligase TRIM33-like [Strongylocentrotus purpuratus]|uniref:C2H2-type domain-containing protein n=1 Tax=Strongylocentrotus purpuratus TaxID=7668 RepID=A0A7M7T0X5_STRPU|nr:E3 ubiquitin-protein ligase TRIM33-like [Strongylocentrotus purpuratus]